MSPIPGIIASSVNVAAGAFESIATANGTGSSGTVTFSNIPSGYQHLQIRFIGKTSGTTSALNNLDIRFNGDNASNYARHILNGTGSTTSSTGTASQVRIRTSGLIPNSSTALNNMFGVGIIDIYDYLSTSKNKVISAVLGVDTNSTTAPVGLVSLTSGLWFATPQAITSIELQVTTITWTTTSQFALYGIKGA